MQRRGEHGLSTIEVLVMLVVMALAASVAMQGLGAGVRQDFLRAQDGLGEEERRQGEATFRTLLQGGMAGPDGVVLEGDAQSIKLTAHLDRPTLCTVRTGAVRVTLRIVEKETGGALECASEGRAATLARWTAGRGEYAYGATGDWRPTFAVRADEPGPIGSDPSSQGPPQLVRFTVTGDTDATVWIERAPVAQTLVSAPPMRRPDGGGDLDR